jgi:subtilisin
MPAPRRFIILPPLGVRLASAGIRLARRALPLEHFLASIARPARRVVARGGEGAAATMQVLDSVHADGAKLVEMRPEDVVRLRSVQPGVRIVPEVFFRPARAPRPQVLSVAAAAARQTVTVTLRVVSRADGKPVARADVIAFTDYAASEGGQGRTDAAGKVRLRLRATAQKVERLFVFPALGFWGALGKNMAVKAEMEVGLRPIDLRAPDALRHFYGFTPLAMGRAVTVGIIDTGVGDHPDLAVEGGTNTVQGEKPGDWRDNGAGHGTHVAGIVAGRGVNGRGVRGLAPGVHLRSYRVFGKGDEGASNYAILKALDRAVEDGCDLVNMSLGGPDRDEATRSAMVDARAQGTLVICAAGNDGRGPVSYPGAEQLAIAVSAMGRKGTFPADSTHAAEVMAPYGKDRANFIAGFSNVGPEIDLAGPGVAVVSTVPGGYAAWDGTSMACPAVTGAAAALLARERRALRMVRSQARSDEMARLVFAAARSYGFGVRFEGRGML